MISDGCDIAGIGAGGIVDVAEKNSHGSRDGWRGIASGIVDVGETDSDSLGIRHAGEVHDIISAIVAIDHAAGDGAGAAGYLRGGNARHRIRESKYHGVFAISAATAALDTGTTA